MRFLALPFLAALAALTACGTATQTVSYDLPPTPGGRLCAHQCGEAQDYCHQSCSLQYRQCVTSVQTRAMNDYEAYTREQFFQHAQVELRPSDFERQEPCAESRKQCLNDCDRPFQTCYQECGGHVNIISSCQFLCF